MSTRRNEMARDRTPPDYNPDSNHWAMFDHLIGMLVVMKKHPVKSLIVILGCGSAPFFLGAMLIGLFRGTEFASRGAFDPVAMGSSFGSKVARPVVFGAGQAVEATFVSWSGGEQPVATPVNYQRRTRSQQNWAVVPTNYEGN